MGNIRMELRDKKGIPYTSFIFSTSEFNKIKSLLARNIQFYKHSVNSDDTVEIDIGTMISLISSILLKIHISCDLEYLQEMGVVLYQKYKKCLDSFLAIYPDFNIQGKALSGENNSKRRSYSNNLLKNCVTNNDTLELEKFIDIVYKLNNSLINIYKQKDLMIARESVIDGLKYISSAEEIKKHEERIQYYLDTLDLDSAVKYLKELQKIIVNDWHKHITNYEDYVPGKPFNFLCHSTNSINFEGGFYSRFVSTSLLTETFTTTYNEEFGFVMDDTNIVMASGHDMFVDNTAKDINDILPTTIPTIDSFGKVLMELEQTSKAFINKKIEGSIYSEIVVDGFKPKAIFCLSDGSKELNSNYYYGKILSEKFDLPLVDIDLTLYKKGDDLNCLKKKLIINIEKIVNDKDVEEDDNYYDKFDSFWCEYMKLKTGDFKIEDVLKLYYKSKRTIKKESIKQK